MKVRSNISTLIKIAKKWAKNGRIEPLNAARAIILTADELNKASRYNNKGKLKRKDFSEKTKKTTLIKQNHKCNICREKLDNELCDFDHIDGDRSNNSTSNCQALCPICHAKKTRKKRKRV